MRFRLIAGVAALFLLFVAAAWPQASNSTVRGAVRDSSQAVIPAAKVTLTNTETNVARETPTNDVGLYVFPGVIPGSYRITVESSGLQKFEATLTVEVEHDATVDAVLAPAQSTTAVEVHDVTALVSTDTTAVGTTIQPEQISSLPINGRNYLELLATVPGVDQGSVISGSRVSQSSIVQAYGYRTNTAAAIFDGAQRNETYEGWDYLRPPGLDSISEMRIETDSASAKFASPLSIVMSSRSGTNAVHGSLFDTNRNSGYGIARRRQDFFTNGKPPYLNRDEFGMSLGGPVYIPKIYNGKNRTFFYVGWEGEENEGATSTFFTVPTNAMRNGDFSGLINTAGQQTNIYNPYTTDPKTWARQQFIYGGKANVIDPALESPLAKYLISIFPAPTMANVNPLVDNNWLGPILSKEESATGSVRLDHRFSENDLIFARGGWDSYWRMYTSGMPSSNNVAGVDHQVAPQKSVMFTWVHTFSPTMTNEVLGSESRQNYHRGMGDNTTNYSSQLGLPNPFGTNDWPGISAGLATFNSEGGFFYQITDYVSLQDNATKIVGKHELQFGVQGRYEFLALRPGGSHNGGDDFSTLATGLYDPSTGTANPGATALTDYPFANMYLGVGDYNATFQRPWVHFRRHAYAPYFQDNWKVTPRLTLNLGLRWELRMEPYDRNGTMLGFDLNKGAYVIGMDPSAFVQRNFTLPSIMTALQSYGGALETNTAAGLPSSLVYNNWKKLGPRVGFAYRATTGARPIVIRSGYRISYYPQKLQDLMSDEVGSAPISATFAYNASDASLAPDGLSNYGLRSTPRCVAGVSALNCINVNTASSLTPGSFSAYYADPHHTDGKVMDWNFTMEREVAENMVARVSYIGNWSTNQQTFVSYNENTPTYIWYATQKTATPSGLYANTARRAYNQTVYGDIMAFSPIGYSHNKTFQFEFERRYHKGLAFHAFYVVGKTLLTNRDTDSTQSGETVRMLNYYLPGAVPADLNTRNHFLNYKLDDASPKQTMRWDFLYDLPVGKGKRFAGNANPIVDKIIGGWQISGVGRWQSTRFSLPTTFWFVDKTIQDYAYKYPVQDCRTGSCYPGYLWYNGYIDSNLINSVDANGHANGYEGIPANYKPSANYFVPYGQTGLAANAPANTTMKSYWDTNTVWLPLNNGSIQRTTYNDNMQPWRNQWVPGPIQWFQDASLFKSVRIHEKVNVRFNIDFFNVLNNPNNPTSVAATGFLSTRSSGSNARITQLTLRVSW